MSANQISNDPAANAPDAAAYKGKGKATEDPSQDLSMDEESEESENENENEEMVPEANTPSLEDEEGQNGLEPISSENIISGGRRTRGKNIDFQEAAEKTKDDEMDDDDDDEDFAPQDNDNNENNDDDQMRD